MAERIDKFFVIVRLFPGWEQMLNRIETCSEVYRSMRVEVQPMNFIYGLQPELTDKEVNYRLWTSLHKSVDFDSSFDILIKKDLTRLEMMELVDRLHNPITPDILSIEEPSYDTWMLAFQDVLGELEELSLD